MNRPSEFLLTRNIFDATAKMLEATTKTVDTRKNIFARPETLP